VGITLNNLDFSDVYRLGKPEGNMEKPRAVMVKFTRFRMKKDIYASRLRLREGDTQIYVNEDLIPSKSKQAYEVRQICRKNNLTCWTQNSIIQYKTKGSNEKPKSISNDEELKKFTDTYKNANT
jgi:hypothetical protein